MHQNGAHKSSAPDQLFNVRTKIVQERSRKGTQMKPEDFLKDVQGKIGDLLRQSPAKDVERNVKAVLAQGF